MIKQNEITGLNQDGARLVAELSLAQKSVYDLQSAERKHISEIESFKVATGRIVLLESESATKEIVMAELKNQLTEISTHAESLKLQIHEQQLELIKSLAVVETQKMIMTDWEKHFGTLKPTK